MACKLLQKMELPVDFVVFEGSLLAMLSHPCCKFGLRLLDSISEFVSQALLSVKGPNCLDSGRYLQLGKKTNDRDDHRVTQAAAELMSTKFLK